MSPEERQRTAISEALGVHEAEHVGVAVFPRESYNPNFSFLDAVNCFSGIHWRICMENEAFGNIATGDSISL
jgi:hypothetical protein